MDWEELCEDYAKLKGKDICAFEAPIREEVEENMDLLAFETDNPKMAWETISLFGFLKDLLELVFGSMICLMNLTHEMRVFQQRQGLH